MGIVFDIRGNSYTAYYSGGVAIGTPAGGSVSIVGGTGGLSGNVINVNYGIAAGYNWIAYSGYSNLPATAWPISILMRIRLPYSGAPSSDKALFSIGTGNTQIGYFELRHVATSGDLWVTSVNTAGSTVFNSGPAWTTNVAGTWYDLVVTWDGTTNSGGLKVYINAVSIGSLTAGATYSGLTNGYFQAITIGTTRQIGGTSFELDEFVIWDTVIDPTSVVLESGTGSLNGASRTSLVASSNFNGSISTDPGVATVLSGQTYEINGVTKTGTLSIANSVWDEPVSSHTTTGTFGKLVQQVLTLAQFLGLK